MVGGGGQHICPHTLRYLTVSVVNFDECCMPAQSGVRSLVQSKNFFFFFAEAFTHLNTRKLASVRRRAFCVRVVFIKVASLPMALAKCLRVGRAKTQKRENVCVCPALDSLTLNLFYQQLKGKRLCFFDQRLKGYALFLPAATRSCYA